MIEEGDTVVLQSGERAIVEDIDKIVYDEPITVYNFEVEDFHTYFVSNASVLVHNTCYRKFNGSKQTSSIWKKLNNYRGGTKSSGKGKKQRFYEWDNTHNDIEVYNHKGKHLGSMDPNTGEMYKPAVSGRKIEI